MQATRRVSTHTGYTSSTIIDRYERGEITPSIGVARKLSKALEVTLDYLVGDNEQNGIQDKNMRDAKTRQAYHTGV